MTAPGHNLLNAAARSRGSGPRRPWVRRVLPVVVWGWIGLAAGWIQATQARAAVHVTFSGWWEPRSGRCNVTITPHGDNERLDLVCHRAEEGLLSLDLDIKRWETPHFRITGQMGLDVMGIERSPEKRIDIRLRSRNILFNQKPVDDFVGRMVISRDRLVLSGLALGPLFLKGSIRAAEPFEMNVDAFLNGVALEDFIRFFAGNRALEAEGSVFGHILIQGPPSRFRWQADLESPGGSIQSWVFKRLKARASGQFPWLDPVQAEVVLEDGTVFIAEGRLNLSQKDTLLAQIRGLARTAVVREHLDTREWTLKRLPDEDQNGAMELKYILKSAEPTSGTRDDSFQFIGVEKTLSF